MCPYLSVPDISKALANGNCVDPTVRSVLHPLFLSKVGNEKVEFVVTLNEYFLVLGIGGQVQGHLQVLAACSPSAQRRAGGRVVEHRKRRGYLDPSVPGPDAEPG